MKELIALATALDEARKKANSIEAAAPMGGVYGDIVTALNDTLLLILKDQTHVDQAYQLLLDGNTVHEALVLLPVSRHQHIVWPEA